MVCPGVSWCVMVCAVQCWVPGRWVTPLHCHSRLVPSCQSAVAARDVRSAPPRRPPHRRHRRQQLPHRGQRHHRRARPGWRDPGFAILRPVWQEGHLAAEVIDRPANDCMAGLYFLVHRSGHQVEVRVNSEAAPGLAMVLDSTGQQPNYIHCFTFPYTCFEALDDNRVQINVNVIDIAKSETVPAETTGRMRDDSILCLLCILCNTLVTWVSSNLFQNAKFFEKNIAQPPYAGISPYIKPGPKRFLSLDKCKGLNFSFKVIFL